jgi:LytS/YehU family sensor histidine kinase
MPSLLLPFAEFLRHVAKAGEYDFVNIDDEVSFMHACKALALARAAVGSHVELIANGSTDERVVPLMIGGLFENALKNGFLSDGRLMVTAELTIDERGITFRVRNPCLPGVGTAKGLGYGNRLLQRRLNLHYPGRHSYSFGVVSGEYVVELSLW